MKAGYYNTASGITNYIVQYGKNSITVKTPALFGMINRIFHHIARLLKLREGYRLSLKTLRFCASGLEREKNGLQLLKKIGGNFVLFNFFQILQSGLTV
ncbi:hypothetical protein [Cytobacillus sp. BC1816]|uniref:hypothetical protein n=1 Tax=Cytobacillus sp. BC1816 TaxID=3440154 RepID=UPI003F515165